MSKSKPSSRQFSLAYFFLVIFWISLALGFGTAAFRVTDLHHPDGWKFTLLCLSATCLGTAIGGVFHKMTLGFCLGYFLTIAAILGSIFVQSLSEF